MAGEFGTTLPSPSMATGSLCRHLAIASSRGHVATFDWQAGKLHSEIHLKETVRDIK
mgnify:CR=1 FL=1|jgi:hypothetical protein